MHLRLTTQELKLQREALARFQRFLPTLTLKKQLLFLEVRAVETFLETNAGAEAEVRRRLQGLAPLFADAQATGFEFGPYLLLETLRVSRQNIVGVVVPVLAELRFQEAVPDLATTPMWVDDGIAVLQGLIRLRLEREVLARRRDLLAAELRATSQRINLFEKVMIPRCQENIRRIRIALGDRQAAAVGRAKLAKKKLTGAPA